MCTNLPLSFVLCCSVSVSVPSQDGAPARAGGRDRPCPHRRPIAAHWHWHRVEAAWQRCHQGTVSVSLWKPYLPVILDTRKAAVEGLRVAFRGKLSEGNINRFTQYVVCDGDNAGGKHEFRPLSQSLSVAGVRHRPFVLSVLPLYLKSLTCGDYWGLGGTRFHDFNTKPYNLFTFIRSFLKQPSRHHCISGRSAMFDDQ